MVLPLKDRVGETQLQLWLDGIKLGSVVMLIEKEGLMGTI